MDAKRGETMVGTNKTKTAMSGRAPSFRRAAALGLALVAFSVAPWAAAQSFSEPPPEQPALRAVQEEIAREAEGAPRLTQAPSGAALVALIGIDALLAPLEEGVRQQLIDSGAELSPEQLDHIAAAFEGSALGAGVAEDLDRDLDEPTRREIGAFYASPLGSRLMGFESAGAAALQEQNTRYTSAILEMSAEIDEQPARQALLGELIAAVKGHEVNRLMIKATTRAMLQGIALSNGEPLNPERLESQVDREVDMVWDLIEEFDRLTFAWIYRDAEDAELEGYVAFLRGETGKTFHDVAHAAITARLEEASLALGERLGEAAGDQPI